MSAPPIPFVWSETDKAFRPLPRFHNLASASYGDGEVVTLAPVEDRSEVSHRHEFAALRECWKNLPDDLADQFPTEKHLRKRLLIERGFYHEHLIDCGSNAAALRVAAFARGEDEFAHVVVRGPLVVVRKAKSQSKRKMEPAEFQASKTAILEAAADLIGVQPDALQRNAGRAA